MTAGSATLLVFGLALLLSSWVLLLVISWKEDYAWGLFTLLLPPLSYFFALFKLDKAGQSILLAIAGWTFIFLSQ
jgi:Mn2+/Fe2+ NRAMP family transporter